MTKYLQEKALADPLGYGAEQTTEDFIKEQLFDVKTYIDVIERTFSVVLQGERNHLNDPYEDCKEMSNLEVIEFFLAWKSDMMIRYKDRDIKY